MRAIALGFAVALLLGCGDNSDDDAHGIDAAPANGSPATLRVTTDGLGAGVVHVQRAGELIATCGAGTCEVPVVVGDPYALTAVPLGSSERAGWTGCSDDLGETCQLTVVGDMAVTASYGVRLGVSWNRTATRAAGPADLAAAGDGVVVAGGARPDEQGRSTAFWFAHYRADGTRALEVFDDATAGRESADGIAMDPQGGVVVVVRVEATDDEVRVRRYTPAGALDWSVGFAGQACCGALVIDGAGNSYFLLSDGGHAIVSLTPSGTERWRRPIAHQVFALAVRDDVLVAAGADGAAGWIGTFALDGTPGWVHLIPAAPPGIQLGSVAIDSDGDVAYGGVQGSFPYTYIYGVIDADGVDTQWSAALPENVYGDVAVAPDDSVVTWTVSPSQVRRFTEAGTLSATELMQVNAAPGGLAVDTTGAAYLTAGQYVLAGDERAWPVIERLP